MQVLERLGAGTTRKGLRAGLREGGLEVVEEERVDDLVDVLGAGVVHTPSAPLVVGEAAFEDGSEDRGVDLGPVELLAALHDDGGAQVLGERGDDGALGEEAAVHVGEGLEEVAREGVARVVGRVQPLEEVAQGVPEVVCREVLDVVPEGVLRDETRLVLAEHEEHHAAAEGADGVVRSLVVAIEAR